MIPNLQYFNIFVNYHTIFHGFDLIEIIVQISYYQGKFIILPIMLTVPVPFQTLQV